MRARAVRALAWIVVAALAVLLFAGDKVRSYFGRGSAEIAQPDAAPSDRAQPRVEKSPASEREADKPAPSGAYAPSPADAPELYDSPTRRLGL